MENREMMLREAMELLVHAVHIVNNKPAGCFILPVGQEKPPLEATMCRCCGAIHVQFGKDNWHQRGGVVRRARGLFRRVFPEEPYRFELGSYREMTGYRKFMELKS
jgi:hypothetical protein